MRQARECHVSQGHSGVQMITHAQAIADLDGAICKGCGRKKGAGKSVCWKCWKLLPRHMQTALYDSIGYSESYANALRCIEQRRMTAKEVGAGRHTRRPA